MIAGGLGWERASEPLTLDEAFHAAFAKALQRDLTAPRPATPSGVPDQETEALSMREAIAEFQPRPPAYRRPSFLAPLLGGVVLLVLACWTITLLLGTAGD
jgi:hypothetical protein